MWLFEQPGFADAKFIENLLSPWFGSFLGMASACVVYGFAQAFLIFQLQFFFLIFSCGFCMGPYNVSQTSFLRRGECFISTKKTPYKGNPCQGKRAVLKHFRLKQLFLVFLIYFHRLGPLSKPKNQVFIRCCCLSSQGLQMRNSLKIWCLLGLGPSWAWLLHV